MLDSAIAINEFQLAGFETIVADLDEQALFTPGLGHGHPPAWIMGHLAVAGESGQRILGGVITHADWGPLFGPGSTDQVAPQESLTKAVLSAAVVDAYRGLRELAARATPESLLEPIRFPLFSETPIKTKSDCVTLLLTNHFGFHLAQLSSCRRTAGHAPLF